MILQCTLSSEATCGDPIVCNYMCGGTRDICVPSASAIADDLLNVCDRAEKINK